MKLFQKLIKVLKKFGINANKIELSANDVLNLLAGNAINLSSKNIIIESNQLQIDENGHMTINCGETFEDSNFEATNGEDSTFITAGAINCRKKAYDGNEANYGINDFSIGYSANEMLQAYIIGTASSYGVELSVGDVNNSTDIKPNKITTPQLTQTSLEAIKKNIAKTDVKALDIINNSDIYTYNLKSEEDETKKHFGFVIGEKYNTPSEVLSEDNQGIDTYSMSSIMWKALQELNKKMEELENGNKN